jgi:hypothetical protein
MKSRGKSLDKCLVQGSPFLRRFVETKSEHHGGYDGNPKTLPGVSDSGLQREIYLLTDGGLISVRRRRHW